MALRWLSDLVGTKLDQFRVKLAKLDSASLTAARTFVLPDTSGTVALTSDLSIYTRIDAAGDIRVDADGNLRISG